MQRALGKRFLLKSRSVCSSSTTLRTFSTTSPNAAKWLGKKRSSKPARLAQTDQKAQPIAPGPSAPYNWSFSTITPVQQTAIKSSIESFCSKRQLEGSPESYISFLEKLDRLGPYPSASAVEKTLHECGLFYSVKDFARLTSAITGASSLIPLDQRWHDFGSYMELTSRIFWAGIAMNNPMCIVSLAKTRLSCQSCPPPEWGLAWSTGRLREQYWRDGSPKEPDPVFMKKLKSAAQDFLKVAHIEGQRFPALAQPAFTYAMKMIIALMSCGPNLEPTPETLDLLLQLAAKPTPPRYWELTSNVWPSARALYASLIYRSDEFLARQLLLEDLKEQIVHFTTPWLLAGIEAPGSSERQRLITLSAEKGNDIAAISLSQYWYREKEIAKTPAQRAEAHMLWREWYRLSQELSAMQDPQQVSQS